MDAIPRIVLLVLICITTSTQARVVFNSDVFFGNNGTVRFLNSDVIFKSNVADEDSRDVQQGVFNNSTVDEEEEDPLDSKQGVYKQNTAQGAQGGGGWCRSRSAMYKSNERLDGTDGIYKDYSGRPVYTRTYVPVQYSMYECVNPGGVCGTWDQGMRCVTTHHSTVMHVTYTKGAANEVQKAVLFPTGCSCKKERPGTQYRRGRRYF